MIGGCRELGPGPKQERSHVCSHLQAHNNGDHAMHKTIRLSVCVRSHRKRKDNIAHGPTRLPSANFRALYEQGQHTTAGDREDTRVSTQSSCPTQLRGRTRRGLHPPLQPVVSDKHTYVHTYVMHTASHRTNTAPHYYNSTH